MTDLEALNSLGLYDDISKIILMYKKMCEYRILIGGKYKNDWTEISLSIDLKDDYFVELYKDKINWEFLSERNDNIKPLEIEKYSQYIKWDNLIYVNEHYPEEFIIKHIDKFNEYNLIRYVSEVCCSENFLEVFIERVGKNTNNNWSYIIGVFQRVSEEFMERHKEILLHSQTWAIQTFSMDFIQRNIDLVNWKSILENKNLKK